MVNKPLIRPNFCGGCFRGVGWLAILFQPPEVIFSKSSIAPLGFFQSVHREILTWCFWLWVNKKSIKKSFPGDSNWPSIDPLLLEVTDSNHLFRVTFSLTIPKRSLNHESPGPGDIWWPFWDDKFTWSPSKRWPPNDLGWSSVTAWITWFFGIKWYMLVVNKRKGYKNNLKKKHMFLVNWSRVRCLPCFGSHVSHPQFPPQVGWVGGAAAHQVFSSKVSSPVWLKRTCV